MNGIAKAQRLNFLKSLLIYCCWARRLFGDLHQEYSSQAWPMDVLLHHFRISVWERHLKDLQKEFAPRVQYNKRLIIPVLLLLNFLDSVHVLLLDSWAKISQESPWRFLQGAHVDVLSMAKPLKRLTFLLRTFSENQIKKFDSLGNWQGQQLQLSVFG